MRTVFLILFFIAFSTQAQFLDKLAFETGYKYKYSNNARFGLSYKLSENISSSGGAPVGFTSWTNLNIAYLTDFKNEHYMMAGIHTSLIFLELGINASTKKDIEPILGLNIKNLIKVNFGYNIAFEQSNNFTFGACIALGLKKNTKYYID